MLNVGNALAQGLQLRHASQQMQGREQLTNALNTGDQMGARQAFNALAPQQAYQMQQPDPAAQREIAGNLIRRIADVPPDQQPQAWAMAVQAAPRLGLQIPPELSEYPGPQGVQALSMLYSMPQEQRAEFERLLDRLPPEKREQAVMTELGILPDANTALSVGAQQQERDPIAALRSRAAEAGLQPGTPEYAQFMMAGGAGSGMAIDVGPDGTMSFRQGPGVQQKPFTEGQSKDNVYLTQAEGALGDLESVNPEVLTSFWQNAAKLDFTGFIRKNVQTPEFQVANLAANEFLQAVLRKASGAAITAEEQMLYGQTYIPEPGDGEAALAQKTKARARAVAAIKAGMSPIQMIAVERALGRGEITEEEANREFGLSAPSQPTSGGAQQGSAPPAGIDAADWEFMEPDERALFQ